MSLKSMTGYGIVRSHSSHLNLESSLRTVNGRFFEFRIHLPRVYASLEGAVKEIVKTYIQRGTVDLYVSRRATDVSSQMKMHVQKNLAKKWLQGAKTLAKELKVESRVQIQDLLEYVPEVIYWEKEESVTEVEKQKLFQLVHRVCQNCDKERKREGLALKKELKKWMNHLQKNVQLMEKLRKSTMDTLHKRYQERLQKWQKDLALDPQKVASEVVSQMDKLDVQEEVTRLKEHIKNLLQCLNDEGSLGKKMDFYSQELLREVNTIGSKSYDSELTKVVVDTKTTIERIREQVQNVE